MLPLLLSMTFLCLIACEKNTLEYESTFDQSYKEWQKFKIASADSYSYQVTNSTWTGSSWVTRITVVGGKIEERKFYYSVWNGIQRPVEGWDSVPIEELIKILGMTLQEFNGQGGLTFRDKLEWTEGREDIGHSVDSPASDLYTLDDVYAMVRSNWLKKRVGVKIYFETENNGLISTAGFVSDDCMDDCFVGIHINSIQSL